MSIFKIKIVPADGTSAANYWEREIRYVLVLRQLSDKLNDLPVYAGYCVCGLYASRRPEDEKAYRDVCLWPKADIRARSSRCLLLTKADMSKLA